MIATADCSRACSKLLKRARYISAQHKRSGYTHYKHKQTNHEHPLYVPTHRLENDLIGKLDQYQPGRAGNWPRQTDHFGVAVAQIPADIFLRPHIHWRLGGDVYEVSPGVVVAIAEVEGRARTEQFC